MITANDNKIEWKEGLTVLDVFKILGYDYSLITVFVNDTFVPEENYETIVPDEANIKLIHICHGG